MFNVFKNIEKVTMITFRCINIFITVGFVFIKLAGLTKASLSSSFISAMLTLFSCVTSEIILLKIISLVNIAEIQTYQICGAGTDCLRNSCRFPDTYDDIFPFFCCQEASHISGNKDYLDVTVFVLDQNFVCYFTFEDIKNRKSFLIRLNQPLSCLGDIR